MKCLCCFEEIIGGYKDPRYPDRNRTTWPYKEEKFIFPRCFNCYCEGYVPEDTKYFCSATDANSKLAKEKRHGPI